MGFFFKKPHPPAKTTKKNQSKHSQIPALKHFSSENQPFLPPFTPFLGGFFGDRKKKKSDLFWLDHYGPNKITLAPQWIRVWISVKN
jgi:hypothetical protein